MIVQFFLRVQDSVSTKCAYEPERKTCTNVTLPAATLSRTELETS